MDDLYLGLVIIAALALAVFRLFAACCRRLSAGQLTLAAACVVAVMGLYVRFVWQNSMLAELLPFSNLIVVGNWFPLFLAALAGIVWRMSKLVFVRRAVLLAALGSAGAYALLHPALGQPPGCQERFSRFGDCVQTTDFTCSAASAATLLRAHGIEATEQEMSDLCLTRKGTSWMGLYRGLKLKTAGTAWDVQIVRCSLDDLQKEARQPMIIEVGLESDDSVDPTFRREYGWSPGMKHSVILSGFARGRAQIIDPAPFIGREEWDLETFQLLWHGYGMRLVPRVANRTTADLAAK